MSQSAQPLSRHELEAKIVKRCWEDDGFRKEFVADPASCFVKYLNAPKAQLPKIVVHEEQAGSWHIVVPAKPAETGELSDEDLEKVAGGTDLIAVTLIATGAAGASATGAYLGVHLGGW